MNTFSLSAKAATRLLVPAVALLFAGCAAGPQKIARACSADHSQNWASAIDRLPVEVHGQLPNATQAETISGIAYGVAGNPAQAFADTGVSLYATQRVVVYIGGHAVPEQGQYCAIAPAMHADKAATPDVLMVRSALCDGPRVIAYVRDSVPLQDLTATKVAATVDQSKAELVASLPLPAAPIPMY